MVKVKDYGARSVVHESDNAAGDILSRPRATRILTSSTKIHACLFKRISPSRITSYRRSTWKHTVSTEDSGWECVPALWASFGGYFLAWYDLIRFQTVHQRLSYNLYRVAEECKVAGLYPSRFSSHGMARMLKKSVPSLEIHGDSWRGLCVFYSI